MTQTVDNIMAGSSLSIPRAGIVHASVTVDDSEFVGFGISENGAKIDLRAKLSARFGEDERDPDRVEIKIPFTGFYESVHSDYLDRALEEECGDENGDFRPECENVWQSIDYSKVHAEYARDYVECFAGYTGLRTLEFLTLDSPMFYNYSTDRIFATVALSEFRAMLADMNPDTMTRICNETFESRPGFASHYSPAWREWGDPDEFDHNQTYAVLLAWSEDKNGEPWHHRTEDEIVQDWNCNGALSGMLYRAGLKMPECANCGSDRTPEIYRFDGVPHCSECERPYVAKVAESE